MMKLIVRMMTILLNQPKENFDPDVDCISVSNSNIQMVEGIIDIRLK